MNENFDQNLKDSRSNYIPALKFDWLTNFFDLVIGITMPEKKIKSSIVEEAEIKGEYKVLDFGCGTGTLSIMMHKSHPFADIYGVDVDDKVLRIAKKKVIRSNANVKLINITPQKIDFQNDYFERVISSLVFHHLTDQQKRQSLYELYRILKPGGKILIADWGKPRNIVMRAVFYIIQIFDGFETTTSNVKGKLPDFIKESGFMKVENVKYFNTIFGTLWIYKAIKPIRLDITESKSTL